jgi:undecaprenyl-diphosphatase
MLAAALYMTLAVLVARTLSERRLKRFTVAVGASLALLVGFTRLYLGVHYPSDVLAGWTAGVTWALACGVVARRLGKAGTVERT